PSVPLNNVPDEAKPHRADTRLKANEVLMQRMCSSSELFRRLHLWSNTRQRAHRDKQVRVDNLGAAAQKLEEHQGPNPSARLLHQIRKERRENSEQCAEPGEDEKALSRDYL